MTYTVPAGSAASPRSGRVRLAWWAAGLAVLAGLVYLMATAEHRPGRPDRGRAAPQSHATVVFNASMIVFREGLEAVLIFAAVTASLTGANRGTPTAGGRRCRARVRWRPW